MKLHTSAKWSQAGGRPRLRTPRPGDLILDGEGIAREIRRVLGRTGGGWAIEDVAGGRALATAPAERGIWYSSAASIPPIEKVCAGS